MIAISHDTEIIGDVWLNSNGSISLVWEVAKEDLHEVLDFVDKAAYDGNMLQIYCDDYKNEFFVAASFHFYVDFKIPFKEVFKNPKISQNEFYLQITKAEKRFEDFFRGNVKGFDKWKKIVPEKELEFVYGKQGFFQVKAEGEEKKYGLLVSLNNFDNIKEIKSFPGITNIISCKKFLKSEIEEKKERMDSIIAINKAINAISTKSKTDEKTQQAHEQIDDLWFFDISYLIQADTLDGVRKLREEFEQHCFDNGMVLYSHGNSVEQQIKSLYPGMIDKNQHLIIASGEKCKKIIGEM